MPPVRFFLPRNGSPGLFSHARHADHCTGNAGPRTLPFLSSLLVVAVIGTLSAAGCGSGGGSLPVPTPTPTPRVQPSPTPTPTPTPTPSPATARASLTIAWPARSRGSVSSPTSALSARVTLVGASPSGQDITFVVDRRADLAAYSDTYTAPTDALVGTWDVHVGFYAQVGATGDPVGIADARVPLAADGSLPDIAVTGLIRSVTVAPGQSLQVGQRRDIVFSALDAGGAILAITPGSAIFTVTAGPDRLRIQDGQAEGLLPGSASVTASVDGIVSPAVSMAVTSNAVVSVTPNPATVAIRGHLTFTATVANAPFNDVTWTVQEGDAGGTITTDGAYTAPATPGTYHIVATSFYDLSRQTVVPVVVQAGGASVGID